MIRMSRFTPFHERRPSMWSFLAQTEIKDLSLVHSKWTTFFPQGEGVVHDNMVVVDRYFYLAVPPSLVPSFIAHAKCYYWNFSWAWNHPRPQVWGTGNALNPILAQHLAPSYLSSPSLYSAPTRKSLSFNVPFKSNILQFPSLCCVLNLCCLGLVIFNVKRKYKRKVSTPPETLETNLFADLGWGANPFSMGTIYYQ